MFVLLNPVGPLGPGPGPTVGRKVGRSDGRTVGRSDGRTDGWSNGRTDGRPEWSPVHLTSLVGFAGDALFNIDVGIFEVWDPSNQLRAEISFNLLQKVLEMVAYELAN